MRFRDVKTDFVWSGDRRRPQSIIREGLFSPPGPPRAGRVGKALPPSRRRPIEGVGGFRAPMAGQRSNSRFAFTGKYFFCERITSMTSIRRIRTAAGGYMSS